MNENLYNYTRIQSPSSNKTTGTQVATKQPTTPTLVQTNKANPNLLGMATTTKNKIRNNIQMPCNHYKRDSRTAPNSIRPNFHQKPRNTAMKKLKRTRELPAAKQIATHQTHSRINSKFYER
jgi:hypothetical protein